MDEFRQRFSPVAVVTFDESLLQIYKQNNNESSSFYECLKKMEALEYAGTVIDGSSQLSQMRRLRVRFLSIQSAVRHVQSNLDQELYEKWRELDARKLVFDDTLSEMSRRLLDGITTIRESTTIDHPVACIHAISANNPDPLQWLLRSQQNLSKQLEPLESKTISSDILHYFIMVCPAESISGNSESHINRIFSEMCHHFGNNICQIIVHGEKAMESDFTAWEGLARSFVAQSLIPFMQNFVNSGVQSSLKTPIGVGLAGKLFSAGRRLLGAIENYEHQKFTIDSPEFLARRAADFLFMLGDWSAAHAAIEAVMSYHTTQSSFIYATLRMFTFVLSKKLKDLTEVYRELDYTLSMGQVLDDWSLDALSFCLRLFILDSSITDDVKLTVFVRISDKKPSPCVQLFINMATMRLYQIRAWYRHSILRLFNSVITSEILGLVFGFFVFVVKI